ncbi:hypothetical protein [Lentzea terrae]|uniref:hypothetical protein n=1 Tax=Lentzea terrae TaxID=2200761 RepID=UPI0013002BDE|nr:hypothetical protein [Lentzea terrae]
MEHTIERASTAHQVMLAAAVVAARFQYLDTTGWLIGDPNRRGGIMLKNNTMWAEHALVHGEIHIVTNIVLPGGRTRWANVPQAAAIWLHYKDLDSPPPVPAGYEARLAEDCGEYADKFAALDKLFEKHHPRDRGSHHYLAFLAAMQEGHGQGTALLRNHLMLLDNRKLGAYLVAADERSRDLYARHGFEQLDQALELPGSDGAVEHVMYPMWRDPQPRQPTS